MNIGGTTPAVITALVGGVGSVSLMLHAGKRIGSPVYLLCLFAVWVASPFVALILACLVSGRWSVPTRTALQSVIMFITLTSLVMYAAVAFGAAKPRPPVFVVVPPASWLILVVVLGTTAAVTRRGAREIGR